MLSDERDRSTSFNNDKLRVAIENNLKLMPRIYICICSLHQFSNNFEKYVYRKTAKTFLAT